jgi:ComF family protein
LLYHLTHYKRIKTVLLLNIIRNLPQHCINLLYPPSCSVCKSATEIPHGVCAQCWADLPLITPPYCAKLGTPFLYETGGDLLSVAAIAHPPVFAKARAVALYDGAAKTLVHQLKYADRMELALLMGRMMTHVGAELLKDADVIIPMPLHRGRLFSRRFNQAAVLARVIAQHSGVALEMHSLRRVRRTRSQVGLTREARAKNVEAAFAVTDTALFSLKDKAVVLVDDVLTTGSTANAASRILLRAGAKSVCVLTFATVTQGS